MIVSIELTKLGWSSDWNGDEVGLYSHERDDGSYSFYLDTETYKVLDFWKDED